MTNHKDWYYYRLRGRLDRAKKWKKEFVETERQIAISDKVTQALGKETPFIYFLSNFINLPIICLTFIKKLLVYRTYKKCKKEIEIIQEEIKQYE